MIVTCVNSAVRERQPGEIIPLSAEHSRALLGNEEKYAASHSIDMKLNTLSGTSPTDGTAWLKVTLDRLSCVDRVVWYESDGTDMYNWKCTHTDCSSCVGDYCEDYSLTVSSSTAAPHPTSKTDCRWGDTVQIELIGGNFAVIEMAVFEVGSGEILVL